MTDAIDIIHRDHVNFDKVLTVLQDTADALSEAEGRATPAQLDLLCSIVYYIRTFPDRVHHPKEEQELFPLLLKRRPDAAALITRLQAQHAEGEASVAALSAAVDKLEKCPEDGRAEVQVAAVAYVTFQRDHIGLEERELLPMARAALTANDWSRVNRAFGRDSDPMFGENLETGFRSLFERITVSR